MAEFNLTVNQTPYTVEADPSTPLLWVVRDVIGLKGTKFGCGMAQCGACTVHFNGNAIRSCILPVAAAAKGEITTIEALGEDGLHPVQQAWIEVQVPQCGYCQSGQVMSAVALLDKNNDPSDEEILAAMQGNICRCGTYPRIKKAIRLAIEKMKV